MNGGVDGGWINSGWKNGRWEMDRRMDGAQMHGWYPVDSYLHCPAAPPRAA